MLVLSRKQGERIRIGDEITICVLEVKGHRVRIGIEAPPSERVLRGELADWERPTAPRVRDRRTVLLAG